MLSKGNATIAPANGRLGILIPGMGAVTSTFVAGVEAVKQGLGDPIGSLTQLGTIRLGKRTEGRTPRIKDFVPLAPLECLSFGAWDIYEDNAYEAAARAKVLEPTLLDKLKGPLSATQPMKAVFDRDYVRRIDGPNVKRGGSKMELAQALMEDIRNFKAGNGCSRLVMIWCGSTEVFHKPAAVHQSLEAFEEGLRRSDADIAPSQILDLVLFLDLAQRAGMKGIQEWLSFYFKGPMTAPGLYPEHDIFIQLMKLKNTLRWMQGEELITHLGLEYYD